MDALYSRCCGIDVHKQTAVACVVIQEASGRPTKEVRTFGTMTDDLLALADWLDGCGVTHVAMESTGVYWKPLWKTGSRCYWSTRSTSKPCLVARPTCVIASGSPICCGTAC